MKRARITVATIEIQCPACLAPISHPETGSHLWDVRESRFMAPFDETCDVCPTTVRVALSKTLRKLT